MKNDYFTPMLDNRQWVAYPVDIEGCKNMQDTATNCKYYITKTTSYKLTTEQRCSTTQDLRNTCGESEGVGAKMRKDQVFGDADTTKVSTFGPAELWRSISKASPGRVRWHAVLPAADGAERVEWEFRTKRHGIAAMHTLASIAEVSQ